MTDQKPRKKYRRLQADKLMRPMMAGHWLLSKQARRLGIKVAWVTSGVPVEPLRAMGIMPLYPENYGALVAAKRADQPLTEAAEAAGYSPDLCSYARISIGSVLEPKAAVMGGLPRPDLLVGCNNICQTVTKWWEALADLLGVPCYMVDTPFDTGADDKERLAYVRNQLVELIQFLESWMGVKYSPRRLEKVIRSSVTAIGLWQQALDTCRASPTPLNSVDRFVYMAPIVGLRGTRAAAAFYRVLLAETRHRVSRRIGAVPGERFRLLWDNIAVWPQVFKLASVFSEKGCAFPVDTYTSAWSGAFEGDDILDAAAKVYADILLNITQEAKLEKIRAMVRDFNIDGVVLHSNRSCKPYSLGQLVHRRQLLEEDGLPVLVIEADMGDSRFVDVPRIATQVEAFVEMLESRASSRASAARG